MVKHISKECPGKNDKNKCQFFFRAWLEYQIGLLQLDNSDDVKLSVTNVY